MFAKIVRDKYAVTASVPALISKMQKMLKDKDFVLKWQDAALEPSDYEKDVDGEDYPIGPDSSDLMPEVYREVGRPDKTTFDLKDPVWLAKAREFIEKRFKEFTKEFADAQTEDGKMVGFRCIATGLKPLVEQVKKKQVKPTGIYWAWTEKGASCYWNKSTKTEVMLKALIPISSIDIERTLIQNLSPFHHSETEIRVKEGAPLELVEVKKKGQEKPVLKVDSLKVVASSTEKKELAFALSEWVNRNRNQGLIDLYQKDPALFDSLPKTKSPVLYRKVYMTRKEFDALSKEGSSWKCNKPLESWSTNPKLHLSKGVGQSFEHRQDPDKLAVTLKRRVPLQDRVAFVPDLDIKTNFSDNFLTEEAEVITKCQEIGAADIYMVQDPLIGKPKKVSDYLAFEDRQQAWNAAKKAAFKKALTYKKTPELGEKLNDEFSIKLIGNSNSPPKQVYLKDNSTGVSMWTFLDSKPNWQMA